MARVKTIRCRLVTVLRESDALELRCPKCSARIGQYDLSDPGRIHAGAAGRCEPCKLTYAGGVTMREGSVTVGIPKDVHESDCLAFTAPAEDREEESA